MQSPISWPPADIAVQGIDLNSVGLRLVTWAPSGTRCVRQPFSPQQAVRISCGRPCGSSKRLGVGAGARKKERPRLCPGRVTRERASHDGASMPQTPENLAVGEGGGPTRSTMTALLAPPPSPTARVVRVWGFKPQRVSHRARRRFKCRWRGRRAPGLTCFRPPPQSPPAPPRSRACGRPPCRGGFECAGLGGCRRRGGIR